MSGLMFMYRINHRYSSVYKIARVLRPLILCNFVWQECDYARGAERGGGGGGGSGNHAHQTGLQLSVSTPALPFM